MLQQPRFSEAKPELVTQRGEGELESRMKRGVLLGPIPLVLQQGQFVRNAFSCNHESVVKERVREEENFCDETKRIIFAQARRVFTDTVACKRIPAARGDLRISRVDPGEFLRSRDEWGA